MKQNPSTEPLNAYGLLGAALGAAIGIALFYFFIYRPDADNGMRGPFCFVLGLINGAFAGNRLGKSLKRK